MANPFADEVARVGTCLHWYRFHDADAGSENDVGTDPDTDITSGTGTYSSQQAGPLQEDDTTYSVQFTDAYLSRAGWSSNDFGSTTTGSISFFFKSSYNSATQVILSGHPDNNNFTIYLLTDGSIFFQGISGANSKGIVTATTGLADGNWHYFFLTCDGSAKNRMYIDGEEVSTTTSGSGLADSFWLSAISTPGGVKIGNDDRITRTPPNQIDLPFIGYLSELGFWSGAVSAGDVSALYNASQTPPAPAPGAGGHRYRSRRTFAGF